MMKKTIITIDAALLIVLLAGMVFQSTLYGLYEFVISVPLLSAHWISKLSFTRWWQEPFFEWGLVVTYYLFLHLVGYAIYRINHSLVAVSIYLVAVTFAQIAATVFYKST